MPSIALFWGSAGKGEASLASLQCGRAWFDLCGFERCSGCRWVSIPVLSTAPRWENGPGFPGGCTACQMCQRNARNAAGKCPQYWTKTWAGQVIRNWKPKKSQHFFAQREHKAHSQCKCNPHCSAKSRDSPKAREWCSLGTALQLTS